MVLLEEILSFFRTRFPEELREEWDNVGLLVGNRTRDVKTVVTCLDVTESVVEFAKNLEAELIVSHHPVIFSPITCINGDTKSGRLLMDCIENKIAVYSADPDVDAQGACIGKNGIRVNEISDELRGEKIDIVKWSEDPVEFITASLSPSSVLSVDINEREKIAVVTVPEYQQSLAIGSKGQNVRLAARLTGWKIDIQKPAETNVPEDYEAVTEE